MKRIAIEPTLESWLAAARWLVAQRIEPAGVSFDDGTAQTLLGETLLIGEAEPLRVPRSFQTLAQSVVHHRDPERWHCLYRLAWRLTAGEKGLLRSELDDDVRLARTMESQVRRDVHKTHAFVRFRQVGSEADAWWVAWHRPEHLTLPMSAPFFVERFRSMRWSILTPDSSVAWDGSSLHWSPGVGRDAAPAEDALEDLWRTYWSSIFNPARVKLDAMTREMPRHHWLSLPETRAMSRALLDAPARVERMIDTQREAPSAQAFVPAGGNLDDARTAASCCRGCPLWEDATQTVFGEGPAPARLMLVGEQPGDDEDRTGRPFTGPSGALLDEALRAAGVDRAEAYVTNAVKHFKHETRGQRRIHKTPGTSETVACRPWLESEIRHVRPRTIVCLGSTAARSLMGMGFRITRERGVVTQTQWSDHTIATWHPAAILRADEAQRERMFSELVNDLRIANAA